MNDVLDTIERELLIAIRRSNARRRRKRSFGVFTGVSIAAAVTAGAGIAAVTDTPIDQLLGGETNLARDATAPRVDVELTDDGGLDWRATTYRDAMGGIVTAIEADGTRGIPRLMGRNGWAIAEGFVRHGPLAGVVMEVLRGADDRLHYLVAGTVAEDAERVVVELGGERQTATLADELVTARVDKRDDGTFTPEGRRLAERLPDEVRVRTFAVTFPPDALRGKRSVSPVVETTVADGTMHRQETGVAYCVSERCKHRPQQAAGPGRAG